MGFIDENGYPLINEEQKIRITLSNRAKLTMSEDMDVFGTPKAATFINLVFNNFKSDAKSSISLYLQQRELELDRLFNESKLDDINKMVIKYGLDHIEEDPYNDMVNLIYKNDYSTDLKESLDLKVLQHLLNLLDR